jgi:pimeloyl-ACP methyl ester carboxylesterase
MKKCGFLTILVILLTACSLPANTTPSPGVGQTISEKRCGDGVCDGPENTSNCPQDCSGSQPTEEGVLWVTNPTSGAALYVKIITPSNWDGTPLPTLILVPGGLGDSTDFEGDNRSVQSMADDSGYTIVLFDPDGRGQSEGEEDKNGHIHQDGLAQIIHTIKDLPEVDSAQIGLVSYSYGVTMASGVLARYPNLPIQFYMDWEGPANREYTTHGCAQDLPGIGDTQGMASCDDEAFWTEREAETFIAEILVPYQRLQFENDHSQDEPTHGLVMVNAAVAGTSPWVRLNDLPPDQTYDLTDPPPLFPGSASSALPAGAPKIIWGRSGVKLDELIIQFAAELFGFP